MDDDSELRPLPLPPRCRGIPGCNECDTVIRTVSAADLQNTFDEMELTLDVASELCPHCGAVNLFSGFSRMMAFTCRQCGTGVLRSE